MTKILNTSLLSTVILVLLVTACGENKKKKAVQSVMDKTPIVEEEFSNLPPGYDAERGNIGVGNITGKYRL